MQIVVTELPIEDAVGRARQRFQQADERLSAALSGTTTGLPWMLAGALGIVAGSLAIVGAYPLPGDVAPAVGIVSLALGGAFLGNGLPLWSKARREKKRCVREWRHALEMLRLREQQAQEDPSLTVEVLDRVDRGQPSLVTQWHRHTAATAKYVQ
jgi:hypothetical protein